MSLETVALCMPLDGARAALLERLVPRWDAMDWGGAQPVWVVVGYDAEDEVIERFRELTRHPVVVCARPDLTDRESPFYVRNLMTNEEVQAYGTYACAPFLHKMAVLREVVLETAVSLTLGRSDDERGPVDWLFWLDSDIDPGPEAFVRLREVLTATTGPLAPRVACGLYCVRTNGQPIPQYWGTGGDGRRAFVALRPDAQVATGFMGFGCTLMRREVGQEVTWRGYREYRERRALALELDPSKPQPILGEDVVWFQNAEHRYGVPLYVDTGVLCRHYHADGSYWEHYADGDRLPTRYVEDEADPALREAVRNSGCLPLELAEYGLRLQPGEVGWYSPEVALTWCSRHRGLAERAPESEQPEERMVDGRRPICMRGAADDRRDWRAVG